MPHFGHMDMSPLDSIGLPQPTISAGNTLALAPQIMTLSSPRRCPRLTIAEFKCFFLLFLAVGSIDHRVRRGAT